MKIAKLSIGNFVYDNKNNRVVKILSIINPTIIVTDIVNNSDDLNYSLTIDDIVGIPLSIENIYLLLDIHLTEDYENPNKDLYTDYYDTLHILNFRDTELMVNRLYDGDNKAWYLHVDNYDYDTLGTGDFVYINEVQNFLTSIDFDLNDYYNKLQNMYNEVKDAYNL